jgi:hypothetical protein
MYIGHFTLPLKISSTAPYLAAVLFEDLIAPRLETAHRIDHLFGQFEWRLHGFRVAAENEAEINVDLVGGGENKEDILQIRP